MTLRDGREVLWEAQPGPQAALIACPVFEVFFGGARGGGKTEGSLGDWLEHSATYGQAAGGVFFRRTFKQLTEVIARSHQLFPRIGAKWNGERSEWSMPGGGRLLFRYLDRDVDADEYQGHNYTRIYVEEVTNFPFPTPINKLKATLRSPVGVPCGMRLTGNPGGPGHGWVKARFIDPAPAGYEILVEEYLNPFDGSKVKLERIFIPSRLSDNKLLMQNDPGYVARLYQAGSKELVNAWLLGLWDMVDGAFFSEFDPSRHILAASWLGRIPRHSMAFRAMDWGYAKPYSIGWYVVSDGKWGLPRGAMVKFWELYGSDGRPNQGLRQNVDQVAEAILAQERLIGEYGLKVRPGVIDPSAFQRDGGPSLAEQMLSRGVVWGRADNKRLPGWQQVRRRLTGLDGRPLLYFLETCQDTIRTFPLAQHDERDTEDLDTEGEDHALDETRYACMARPWVADEPPADVEGIGPPTVKLPHEMTFMDRVNALRRRRLAKEHA